MRYRSPQNRSAPQPEDEALARFLAECEAVLSRGDEDPATTESFDVMYHAQLMTANERGGHTGLALIAQRYLAAAHHASVYV